MLDHMVTVSCIARSVRRCFACASSIVVLAAMLALGCEDEDGLLDRVDAATADAGSDGGGASWQSFESILGGDVGDTPGGGGTGGRAPLPLAVPDPGGLIEEADVVQRHGDRLYALSTYGGLNVIEAAVPSDLRWLGSYSNPDDAEPFQMYLRDGIALVLYRAWEHPTQSEGGLGLREQASRVVALDVRDPERMRELGSAIVAGVITNSRLVGDVLYVMSHRSGECGNCVLQSVRTSVVSLDVSDPGALQELDELHYDDLGTYERAPIFHLADERVYIAGLDGDPGGPLGSVIRVVDTSDPAGGLTEGAVVRVEGEVISAWQLNEWSHVLRVVAQPSPGKEPQAPFVQTFAIESSIALTPLGWTELDLSGAPGLLTVRFDGDRAYATTVEPSDPVHILDLSDPATPVQRGEVGASGPLMHLEPRGDRLLGFGADWENPLGAIVVSLFDVSDLQAPALLGSARFGGPQAQLIEEHQSLRNVVRVLDALETILIPYADAGGTACGSAGAVQIIEWDTVEDALALGASVPVEGYARRALLQDDRLLTASDARLERHDFGDQSAPTRESGVALSRDVSRMVPLASGTVARISEFGAYVDFVDPARVESPQPGSGEFYVAELIGEGPDSCTRVTVRDAFAIEDRLVLLYLTEGPWVRTASREGPALREGLLVIDASDATAASVLSRTEWTNDDEWTPYIGYHSHGARALRSATAHNARAVVVLETGAAQRLRVFDLRAPQAPQVAVVDLPARHGQSGLLMDGDTLITSHYEPIEARSARFFVDRWDLSDPSAPRELPSINVPGALLYYDGASQRAVTVDSSEVDSFELIGPEWRQCAERFAIHTYATYPGPTDDGVCTGYRQRLHLLHIGRDGAELLDTYEVDARKALRAQASGDDVLYVSAADGVPWANVTPYACDGPCDEVNGPSVLLALSGLSGQRMQVASVEVQADAWWSFWSSTPIYAAGSHVVVVGAGQVQIVDASDPTKLELTHTTRVGRRVRHVAATADAALLSRGLYGARRVGLMP